MPPTHALTTELVGRDEELAELTRLAGVAPIGADGAERSGGVVLVSGEAGVGKTRLLTELRDLAETAGWRVVVGHCLDFGDSALPYLPFSELVGRLAQDEPAWLSAAAERHPAVRHLLPGRRLLSSPGGRSAQHFLDDAAGGPADRLGEPAGDVERAELFETVHALVEELAADRPVLVLLEDLHWADRSTRDLLGFLFQRGFAGPVAVVATYRSDDLHRRHPLRAATAEWSRLPGVHRLPLERLSDDSVRRLARSLHGRPLAEPDLQAIVTRAEGNAFFAEELVVATEMGSRSLPDDLASLLLVRVDRLDEAARQVVRAASCAGRSVSHALLAAVVDLGPSALEAALREAVDRNILVPGGLGYAFRHALLAEAVYDDLLPGERVRLHAAYSTALCCGDAEGTPAELARHARAAGDVDTAIRASIEAGDDAMAVGGPDDAAGHYQAALELLSRRGAQVDVEVDVAALTARTAGALVAAGDPHRAIGLVSEQLARQEPPPHAAAGSGPARDRARLLLALAEAASIVDSDLDVLALTAEALGLVGPEPSKLRARVVAAHALANMFRQRVDEATRWADEAISLARVVDLPQVELAAATTLARLEERANDPDSAQRTLEKIVAQARADGDLDAELRGLHHLGALHFELGRLDEAAESYAAAHRRATSAGRPWAPYGLDARVTAAVVAHVAGRWEDVRDLTDVAGERPPPLAEALLVAVRLGVPAGRGESEALESFTSLRAWWELDALVAIHSAAAAIDLFGDRGDLEQALAVHDAAVDTVTELWQVRTFLAQVRLAGLALGQLAAAAGARPAREREALVERGRALAEQARAALRASEHRHSPLGPEGLAWQVRAEAELLRLRWAADVDPPGADELRSSWQAAVELFDRFGHVHETARSRARLATVLRAQGEPEAARPVADLAREAAHRLGARPLLAELRAAGSAPQRGVADQPAPLTPREREILALVAQGRSNGEIARHLYISAKTVSVHVSNILAKLGASGRTEAAAVARDRGLV